MSSFIAIWTLDRPALIVFTILSGIFIGVNNTITTQAVMTVSPWSGPSRRPHTASSGSSAAVSPLCRRPHGPRDQHPLPVLHRRGRRDARHPHPGHRPPATGHKLLAAAERAQAEDVRATAAAMATPQPRLVAVGGNGAAAKNGKRHTMGRILVVGPDAPGKR